MKKNMLNFSTLFAETKKMIIFVPKLVSMNANELRIGNLVYNKHGEVHEIGHNCFNRFRNLIMEGNPSGFQPIPLTEDLLLAAGVKKHPHNSNDFMLEIPQEDDFYFYIVFHISNEGNISVILEGNGYYDSSGELELPRLKYFHQLQNLYFALTGEELTINI